MADNAGQKIIERMRGSARYGAEAFPPFPLACCPVGGPLVSDVDEKRAGAVPDDGLAHPAGHEASVFPRDFDKLRGAGCY